MNFDLRAIRLLLRAATGSNVDDIVEAPVQIREGIENRNFHLSVRIGGTVRRFVLRCPPEAVPAWRQAHGLYDLAREYRVLRELESFGLSTPRAIHYDAENRLGMPSLLMERLPGQPLTPALLGSTVSVEAVAECFAAIARLDWGRSAWLSEHLPRWSHQRTLDFLDQNIPVDSRDALFRRTREWLDANRPADGQWVLSHGDFNLGNLLLDDGRITGIVDWEFACLASDPLEQVAFYPWLYGEEVALPLLHAMCDALRRDAEALRWFVVKAWLGFAYSDPAHPQFEVRCERLRAWMNRRG